MNLKNNEILACTKILRLCIACTKNFEVNTQFDYHFHFKYQHLIFRTALRSHHIPEGLIEKKLNEFLALNQGTRTVLQYAQTFNHLCHATGGLVAIFSPASLCMSL